MTKRTHHIQPAARTRVRPNNQVTYIIMMLLLVSAMIVTNYAHAKTFRLPPAGSDVVGSIYTIKSRRGDHLSQISQCYDVGFDDVVSANPRFKQDRIGRRTKVVIPDLYILPDVPWTGIVVNLAEKRLYYFPPGRNVVQTYPVGIGKKGSATPLMTSKIGGKRRNPSWRAPASVRREVKRKYNIILPDVMPPGPDNPLGKHAMRLGKSSYLIHGTGQPWDVGRRISAGCIRMYPEDIAELFNQVPIGTQVKIVHQAYKAGWKNNHLYLEAHKPLSEHGFESDHSSVRTAIKTQLVSPPYDINWSLAKKVGRQRNGVPVRVGVRSSQQAAAEKQLNNERKQQKAKNQRVKRADVTQHGMIGQELFRHSFSQG